MEHSRGSCGRMSAWRRYSTGPRSAGEGCGNKGGAIRCRHSAAAHAECSAVAWRAWAGTLRTVAVAILLGGVLAGCASQLPAPVTGWDDGIGAPQGYYRIREGETLSEIAVRLKLDLSSLVQWNGLAPPYRIFAGKLLRVAPPPAVGEGATASTDARNAAHGSQVRSARDGHEAQGPAAAQPGANRGEGGPISTARDAREKAPKAAPLTSEAAAETGTGTAAKQSSLNLAWQWPLRGAVEQTFVKGDRMRSGIRIRGRPGDPVVAAEAGSVVYSGSGLKGYGNLIIVKHNKNYLSAYGFNRRLLVREGDQVKRGQAVAEIGQAAGGSWLLHFEIRKNGTAVDPLGYLPRSR
jgi:lipoprotein NlpD